MSEVYVNMWLVPVKNSDP